MSQRLRLGLEVRIAWPANRQTSEHSLNHQLDLVGLSSPVFLLLADSLLGRLAPVLLQDLYLYDPNQDIPRGGNLLRDGPLEIPRDETLGGQLPPNSCKHVFWLKPKQSSLQDLDKAPKQDTVWIVAAVCSKCRIHLSLKVDFASRWVSQTSPEGDRPEHQLHHLVRSKRTETLDRAAWDRQNPGQMVDLSVFECSLECCSAIVSVYFTPAVISDESTNALTDPDRLRARTEAAFNFNANNTQGMRAPTALDVLNDLRIYLKNSWSEGSLRTIKTSNRRFMVRFGPDGRDCKGVLETFGFRFLEVRSCSACLLHTKTLMMSPGWPARSLFACTA